jgi:glutathione S-transferase
MTGTYELIIGDKNYSSWSLRPWLLMTHFSIPFTERLIKLRSPDTRSDILAHSPSGKVPALKIDDIIIWDSLAIVEFLAESHPDKPIWPANPKRRAIARSAAAEMHSGFYALRNEFPMDFVNMLGFPQASDKACSDIARIVELWIDCRARFGAGGPFLFGEFCAADAMFAPVASRFVTYEAGLAEFGDDGTAARYRDTIMAMPALRVWADAARAEI